MIVVKSDTNDDYSGFNISGIKIVCKMKITLDISDTQNDNGWYLLLIPTIIYGSFTDAYEFGIGWFNKVVVLVFPKNKE